MSDHARRPELLPVDTAVPLYVDLDGSLLRSDSLWECFWSALRADPVRCLTAIASLAAGRAQFKRVIAERASLHFHHLPYREDVIAFLSAEFNAGRPLVLATAADEFVAAGVSRHLGIFSHVIASDGVLNRKGHLKLEAIQARTSRFLYLGDSMADLPIWRASEGCLVAGGNRKVLRFLQAEGLTIQKHFPGDWSLAGSVLRAIRVHQWPKNLLVLLPIFLGHRTMDALAWRSGLSVLLAFCLAASAAYVLNDLLDLEADRQHPAKRARPFASGELSIPFGLLLFTVLACGSFGLTTFLSASTQVWIGIYFAATLLYSFYLKTIVIADVVGLASFYTIRVIAGGAAAAISISPWTLAFCLFCFYSLALAKRFGELRALGTHDCAVPGRGYESGDTQVIALLGVSSGVVSVVVFSLYISSPEVGRHYTSPGLLWLACPVLLYWFGRLWLLANRGVIAEDPLLFSSKDRISYLTAACIAIIWLVASVYQ